MKSAYDDLSQEMWNSADDNMPQDYLDSVVTQTMPPKPKRPAGYLDSISKITAIWARNFARQFPRKGQPSFDAPLIDWYHEYYTRARIDNEKC